MNSIQDYYYQINYLESLSNIEDKEIRKIEKESPKIYIDRLNFLLKILGNPQEKIKNYIHIGGTSGKGSVSNFLHEILIAAGYKSGLFTSPFLTETIEKFRVNEKFISPREFSKLLIKIKPAIEKCMEEGPYGIPSYFEICYVMGLLYFLENDCDYIVAEVGMGGEFDATNIIKNTKISTITHIDFDHTQILGKTLEKIAKTKSKIIKEGSTFLTSETRPEILKIFKDECKEKGAQFIAVDENDFINPTHTDKEMEFEYQDKHYRIGLFGYHQIQNAILAIEIAKKLEIEEEHIWEGLSKTKIPGRFEILKSGKCTMVLDVAHNPDKMASVLENLKMLRYRKLHVLYASGAEKDYSAIAKILAPVTDYLYLTRFLLKERKCAHPLILKDVWLKENPDIEVQVNLDPLISMNSALKRANKEDLILVTGSFFLVGEVRKSWFTSGKVLRNCKI